MMKRCILQFLTFLFILIFSQNLSAQNGNGFDKIVLDAGHGGYDKGAVGNISLEKKLTLDITLKAGKLLQDSLPGIRVIYTRKKDVFVELHKRAAIANDSMADLFISVHCNSNLSPKPFGTETYVMGLHKSSENLEVAKTENAAILMEENYLNQYDGFDPNLDEDYITLNMFQSAHIEQSLDFSQIVQSKMRKVVGMYDRGVKQAGFVVLYLTTMPGILLETGFISNPAEEKFLLDPVNQDKIALAILEAVKDYKYAFEKPLPTIIEPVFTETKIVENTTEIIFRIGFASFAKLRPSNDPEFEHLPDVKYFYENGSYLYTFGAGLSKDDALSVYNLVSEKKLISKKYLKNPELITFEDNQIVSRESLKLYLKKKE
jgi:N-acetylmuramoyl-L-alanine amidase